MSGREACELQFFLKRRGCIYLSPREHRLLIKRFESWKMERHRLNEERIWGGGFIYLGFSKRKKEKKRKNKKTAIQWSSFPSVAYTLLFLFFR